MDIRDLRYVIALNDCGTLTRAADRLHVSRQAVAKTVRNLEAEAGARLFERIDAGHVPTDRGEELVSGGRRVVAAFDQLCERTLRHPGGAPDARGELREPLNIALVTGGRKAVPKGLFERYAAMHPQVALNIEEMSTDAALEAVERGNADVGIVGSHPTLLGSLDFTCVRRVSVWLYIPADHPLASRPYLELSDLNHLPLVTAGQHNHVHRFVMQRCADEGIHPNICATVTDSALLGHLLYEYNASCFGFPPSVSETPRGFVALRLSVEGGEWFGTYVVRKPAGPRGSGADMRRATKAFWSLAQAVAE